MPLLDHFHNPDRRRLPWTTISQARALALIGWLNRRLPRDEFRAESFPDELEIEIREEHDRARLVGVIELISPANKDRRAEREAFVAKCVTYLKRGIGLAILDAVTERHANLHNELLEAIAEGTSQLMPDTPTYVSGYRPVHRRETGANEIEIWPYPVSVGPPIPAVPLGLRGGPVVLLDLEGTYTAAIEATGL